MIFGNALADVFKNQFYVKLVIENAQNSVLREANLKTLVEANPEFKMALNNALGKYMSQTSLKTEDDDVFTYLSNQLTYDTLYISKIVIPNLLVLNPDKSAITSSGLELDEDIDTTLDDHIWAKKLNEASELTDIIINEAEAKVSENPVLIFGNGEDEAKYANSLVFGEGLSNESPEQIGGGKTESTATFDFISVSIKNPNYFYEGSGKNEYQYTGIYFTQNETWGWIFTQQNSSNRLRRFKENQCNGEDFSINEEFFHAGTHFPPPTDDIIVFMNTYERDWYATLKDIGSTTLKGQTAHLTGKTVYASQWYAANGGVLFTGNLASVGGISVKENEKTKIQVIRNN